MSRSLQSFTSSSSKHTQWKRKWNWMSEPVGSTLWMELSETLSLISQTSNIPGGSFLETGKLLLLPHKCLFPFMAADERQTRRELTGTWAERVNDLSTCWRCWSEEVGRGGRLHIPAPWCQVSSQSHTNAAPHSSPHAACGRGGIRVWPNSGHTAGCVSRQPLPVMKNTSDFQQWKKYADLSLQFRK